MLIVHVLMAKAFMTEASHVANACTVIADKGPAAEKAPRQKETVSAGQSSDGSVSSHSSK